MGKIKKYHKILTKFKLILLNIMKITSGTKVPKIANFVKKWDFCIHFASPNITLLSSFFIFSRFAQSKAFNPISDSANYFSSVLLRFIT